jgi:hypothetical protein
MKNKLKFLFPVVFFWYALIKLPGYWLMTKNLKKSIRLARFEAAIITSYKLTVKLRKIVLKRHWRKYEK